MSLVPISRAYGLDRAGDRILLARWERGRESLVIAAPADDSAVRQALAEARAEVATGRAAWAVASPPEATFLKELQTPIRSPAKAARVWGGLLDVELPVPLDEMSWTVAHEAPSADGRRAVVAAIEKREARAFLERLLEEGAEATHLDAFPAAAYSLLPPGARPDAYRVLVWLGDRAVAAAGGCGPAVRSFHLLRAEPRNDDAFVSRFVSRADHFLDIGRKPDIYWAGPGAADADLLRALEEALLASGVSARFSVLPGGEGVLACKLAERAARAASVQLAPPDAVPAAWAARSRRLAEGWRLAAAVAALALCTICGIVLRLRAVSLDRARQAVAAAAAELAGTALPPGQETLLLGLPPYKDAIQTRARAFDRLANPDNGIAADLSAILGAAQDAGIDVASCDLSASAVSLVLAPGSAPEAIDAFADALAAAGWETKRSADAGKSVKLTGVRTK